MGAMMTFYKAIIHDAHDFKEPAPIDSVRAFFRPAPLVYFSPYSLHQEKLFHNALFLFVLKEYLFGTYLALF